MKGTVRERENSFPLLDMERSSLLRYNTRFYMQHFSQ